MTEKIQENEKDKKDYHYNYIQFTVSDEEKQLIEDYTEKAGFNTISKFIREAIDEKIMRMKQNIPFIQSTTPSITLEQVETIIDTKLQSQNKIIEERSNELKQEIKGLYERILKDSALIQENINKEEYMELTETLKKLVKVHKSLNVYEAMDYTNKSFRDCWAVLSNTEIFEFNITNGRFYLK